MRLHENIEFLIWSIDKIEIIMMAQSIPYFDT